MRNLDKCRAFLNSSKDRAEKKNASAGLVIKMSTFELVLKLFFGILNWGSPTLTPKSWWSHKCCNQPCAVTCAGHEKETHAS